MFTTMTLKRKKILFVESSSSNCTMAMFDHRLSPSVPETEERITESSERRISAAAVYDGKKQQPNRRIDYHKKVGKDGDDPWERRGCSTVDSRCRKTAKYDVRWETVMGKKRPECNSGPTVTPLLPVLTLHSLCQLLVITFLLVLGGSQGCKVEQCWRRYTHVMDQQKLIVGPNLQYCILLKSHLECIRNNTRACRGDLKYHSAYSLVMQWTQEYNCSYTILHAASLPPITKAPRPAQSSVCTYKSKPEFQQCSLFGDPHLRTFRDEHQTCKVLGAWPLVDNAYLAVQVTNEAVVPESSATATTKVTVIIKETGSPCAQHKTYEAQVDNVPSAFIDGTQSSGIGDDRYVRIKEKSSAHVEIYIRYIATTVVIRQAGRYLSVYIRMPKDIVRQGVSPGAEGMQLCSNGCPSSEQIPYKKMLALASPKHKAAVSRSNSAISRDEAIVRCKEYNVTDFYFDSCVFDLMTTGDEGFGEAASKALLDLWRFNPKLAAEQRNRTVLSVPLEVPENGVEGYKINNVQNSGPGRPQPPLSLLLSCAAIVIIALNVFLKSN
ncbi:hypothetical protein CHUAL_011023 [Chamberlinius hualienensis]